MLRHLRTVCDLVDYFISKFKIILYNLANNYILYTTSLYDTCHLSTIRVIAKQNFDLANGISLEYWRSNPIRWLFGGDFFLLFSYHPQWVRLTKLIDKHEKDTIFLNLNYFFYKYQFDGESGFIFMVSNKYYPCFFIYTRLTFMIINAELWPLISSIINK